MNNNNPDIIGRQTGQPKRKSIRLKGYDYSQAGLYFITICTQNRLNLFGKIDNGKMILNNAGEMVEKWYYELKNKFPDIKCCEMVVMSNHIHFIIQNTGKNIRATVGADLCVSPNVENNRKNNDNCSENNNRNSSGEYDKQPVGHDKQTGEHDQQTGEHDQQTGEHAGSPLHRVVQWFKTMTTNEYIRGVKQYHWQSFDGKLWQRNYWEHIVRNQNEHNRIAQYLTDNPKKWGNDKLNGGNGNIVMESTTEYNHEIWMV